MNIWDTLSGFFGGGTTTPGTVPGAGQPPTPAPVGTSAPHPADQLGVTPVARGVAEAKGLIEPQLKTEKDVAEEVVEEIKDDAKAENAKQDPWSFTLNALGGLKTTPDYLTPGRTRGAGIGDTSLLDYYARAGQFNNTAPAPQMGLLKLPGSRYY